MFIYTTKVKKIASYAMLITMLHSSFVEPIHSLLFAYINKKEGIHYSGFRATTSTPISNCSFQEMLSNCGSITPKREEKFLHKELIENVIYSDINHGYIGTTASNRLDDVRDNIFKFNIPNVPKENVKVFLTYELYGISDFFGVSRSINDRLATGGHIIKNNDQWTLQKEEIDVSWLKAGVNRVMFSLPEGMNLQYQVKNLRIEFEEIQPNAILPILVSPFKTSHYIKENKIYLKGFIRNIDSQKVKVFIENSKLKYHDGEFEGFLELNKEIIKRKYIVIKALDENGLLGQEYINISHLNNADFLYPVEQHSEKAVLFIEANEGGFLSTEGASITIKDSALLTDTEINLTHLRKIDVAPMASGMINVTKGGAAYRFLPDGIKFNKKVSISIGYDQKLIPKGYTAKDIKTYYFNTETKSWNVVEKEYLNENEKTVVSLTDHFTDYINGIIQTPESPETAGFTPTMMQNIKAADPSAEMTLISPPSVSQTGEANISYPIKIPSGRNGMQPNLNLQYNSDAGSGWLGQGWNISIPSLSIDTRWGVPVLNDTHETVIYTLNGEQLMYPKFLNADNMYVDWMPNRHYDSTSTVISTFPREKIPAVDSKFSPRKQGSFAKIERLGNNPTEYYWKVTHTDGSISWYGGKTAVVENSVLKNASNQIVYWALYMTEDIHKNNIKYTYSKNKVSSNLPNEKSSLSDGTIFNILKINYTGYQDSTGLYEISFLRSEFSEPLRTDASIDARLGIKIIDPCKLKEIIIKNNYTQELIRKYKFSLTQGEFNKSLLAYFAENDSDDREFYRHTFEYYNDVRKSPSDPLVLFDRPYDVTLPNFDSTPDFSLGIGNIAGYSKLNTIESIEAGWGLNMGGGLEFRLGNVSNDPFANLTLNVPFGESYPKDRGIVTMADIDGDGLEDIIYKSSLGLRYYSGYIDVDNKIGYNEVSKKIEGITNFSRSKGKTKTMFLESHNLKARGPFSGKKYYFGRTRTKSNVNTDIFFTDGNGDGLIDIVKDNIVLFNQGTTQNGGRQFGNSSSLSPNMLITAQANVIPPIEYEDDDNINDPQGYDAVRVWIAPKTGLIKIEDVLQLNTSVANRSAYYSIETSNLSINNGQPFRIYIHELTTSSPSHNITLLNYQNGTTPLHSIYNGPLSVVRGQKIFFRISKNSSENNVEVTTNPTITYLNELDINILKDENLVNHTSSSFSDGFILSSNKTYKIDKPGCLTITWDSIPINNLNDDVTYRIVMQTDSNNINDFEYGGGVNGEEELFKQTVLRGATGLISVGGNQLVNGADLNYDICFELPVVGGKRGEMIERNIRFEVLSPSNLKWKEIQWKPKIVFVPNVTNLPTGMVGVTKVDYPVAKYSIYKTNLQRKLAPVAGWTTPNTNEIYTIQPNTTIINNSALNLFDFGIIRMVVKKNGQWVGSRKLIITAGTISVDNSSPIVLSSSINLNNPASQFYYSVGYYIDNNVSENLFQKYLTATGFKSAVLSYQGAASNASNKLPILVESNYNNLEYLGPLHKEWGQFFYNDELDMSLFTPHDSIGKLINPNVGDRYDALSNAFANGLIDPNDPCFDEDTEEEVKDCLAEAHHINLDLPQEVDINEDTIGDIEMDFMNPGITDAIVSPLFVARATRKYPLVNNNPLEEEKWIGLFDTQYVKEARMKSGSFSGSEFDSIFPDEEDETIEQADLETGMQAIRKQHQSVSVSKTVGWGSINLSTSKSSYSNTTSDFLDINGDHYPDLLSSKKVQFSNMTGGHDHILNHSYGNLHQSANNNISYVNQGGSQDLGRNEGPKASHFAVNVVNEYLSGMEEPSPSNFANLVAATNKEADKGNPIYSMSIGVTANLAGENKEMSMWMDINGDGLPDKIHPTEGEEDGFSFNLNNGGLLSDVLKYNYLRTSTNKPSDISISLSFGAQLNTLLQGPTSSLSSLGININAGYSGSGSDTTTVLLDVNGDGLPDILDVNDGAGTFRQNTGYGFTYDSEPLKTNSNNSITMMEAGNSTAFSIGGDVSLYYGFPICCPFPFIGFIPLLHVKAGASLNLSASLSISNTEKAFKDINGDGFVDYVTKKDQNTFEVFPSKIARTNKLKTVNNPLKGHFTIDYKIQNISYDNPHPKWVMSSVEINDGYNFPSDGQDSYHTSFTYENGYYDRRERSFYGYETVKATNDLKVSVSKYFNKNYFLKGLLKESYVTNSDGTEKLTGTENIYQIRQLNDTNQKITSNILPQDFDTGGQKGRRAAAVVLSSVKNYFYYNDISTPDITSRVDFVYDDFGRVVECQNFGDLAQSSDDFTTIIKYHNSPNLLSKHLLNVASMIEVSSSSLLRKRTTEVDINNGNVLAIHSNYTDNDFVTSQMEYDQYGNLSSVIYPDGGNGSAHYTYKYDSVFNKYIEKIIDAFGYESKNYYNSSFDKIKESIDITGNKMNYNYDAKGRVISIISPKELNTSNKTIEFSYYTKHTQALNASGISELEFVPFAVTNHFDVQHPTNAIQTVTFMDGLGRPIQIKKDITINTGNSQSPNYHEYMSISGRTSYDQYGRSFEQYHPGMEVKSFNTQFKFNPFVSNYLSYVQYDAFDRIVSTVDANGNATQIEYSIEQDNFNNLCFKTKTTVPQSANQNLISETYKNVQGNTVSTMNVGDNDLWTQFSYNPIGVLMSYKDAEDLETTYDYDLLGRKLSVKHPDQGMTQFTYDDASNLIEIATANLLNQGTKIDYIYDINRITDIIYPNTNGTNLSNVSYKYGNSGNETGRVVWQKDATGQQEFKYGNMGELEQSSRIVVGPNIPTRLFNTEFKYDSWNRLQNITYPDGELVNYYYDLGGNLTAISSDLQRYIKQIDYDHFEQRTYLKYGNETETFYNYEPQMRRMSHLDVLTPQNEHLLRLRYQYDKVGNVLSLENNANILNNGMGGLFYHYYSYDKLNRLASANGDFVGQPTNPESDYQSTYGTRLTYNNTHGIATKEQDHLMNNAINSANSYSNTYKYEDGTHRVEYIDNGPIGESFKYDLNGNMIYRHHTEIGQSQYFWDESNRLRVVSSLDTGIMQHFIYDATGERVLKASSPFEQVYENGSLINANITFDSYTTYPSAFLVIDPNGIYSKHYYAGSQRIVSRLGEETADIFNIGGNRESASNNDPEEFDEEKLRQAQVNDLKNYLKGVQVDSVHFKEYKASTYQEEEALVAAEKEEDENDGKTQERAPVSAPIYFYHPDHLGSSTFLTDANGNPYQFFINLPFGETMAQQLPDTYYKSPFKFNGKELDEETGLYYYGARYYDPRISIWLSVDPLAEVQPDKTPYHYCSNNPVMRIDPTGMIDGDFYSNEGKWLGHDGVDDGKVYVLNSNRNPNYKNENVNWGGQLSESHASDLKQNSQEAKMPGKITHSLDKGENASADKYNVYDKEIAVATHLFNREISNGTASIGDGYKIGTQATPLDVNLVKSLAYKESRLGQGASVSTNASDIFSMFHMGDYGDKYKMGMTKSDVTNGKGAIQSTHWGVRWLYFKSMVSPDGKTKNFKGWDNAIQRYGPGSKEPGYKDTVMKIYKSIQ